MNLIVKRHNPWRMWLLLIVTPLLIAASAWGAYQYGREEAGQRCSLFETQRQTLQEQVDHLKARNQELREQLVTLERSAQVDRQAYEQVRSNLDQLQNEILGLREEVNFYRGIVSPEETGNGLHAQSLTLTASGERMYRYRLVLTHIGQNKNAVQGVVQMSVEGFLDGAPQTLPLAKLSGAENIPFRFRYFQNMEGDLRLPEGFVPSRVMVELRSKGSKNVSRGFPWPDATPPTDAKRD